MLLSTNSSTKNSIKSNSRNSTNNSINSNIRNSTNSNTSRRNLFREQNQ